MRARTPQRRLRDDAGFTLTEVLIATLLGLMLVGTAATVFAHGIRTQPRLSERSAQIQQARTMAETLSRELRQGSNATSTTPADLSVLTYVPHSGCGTSIPGTAIRCKVFYYCSAGSCTRTECGPNAVAVGAGCGPTRIAVEGLADEDVFAFTPRIPGQAFVSVRLSFPASDSEDAITIEDGVALRNPPLGGP